MTERTVTDLETTALDILRIPPGRRTVTDEQDCFAAVRELARRAERLGGFPLSRERLLDRIEEAEADRDRLQAHCERMVAQVDALTEGQIERNATIARYREALEQIEREAEAGEVGACWTIANGALATPDTPHTISCASRSWFDEKPGECDCGATPDTPPDA